MIPVLTILTALVGLLGIVAGIAFFVLRKIGQRPKFSSEQEKTAEALREAFGDDMKWGSAGGTESEMHDHASHNHHSSDSGTDSDAGHGS